MRRGAIVSVGATLAACALGGCDTGPFAAGSRADARIELVDVAAAAGVGLVQVSGDPRRWYILESNGTGAAWLDYDLDGDMDLFVGNGQGLRYVEDGAKLEIVRTAASALYRNEGEWRFTDVSAATGCARPDWVQAIATGDVDNDGDPDLYLGCFGRDVFLRNDGGRFVDATDEAGLGNSLWASGAAFADVDRDGALDLYVANYCVFDLADPPAGGARKVIDGVEVGWGPEGENGMGINRGSPDVFYYGDGRGRFREATREAGLELSAPLCSYAVVAADVDLDGDPDFLVANDMQPSNLFINDGRGRFRDEGFERGFALGADLKPTSAMGLAVDDFDGDGDFDVFRTNFDFEPNSLHVNDGAGAFRERAREVGLADASVARLGWGCAFLDVECDGDLDLIAANGHVYPQARAIGMSGWLMQSQLFEAVPAADGAVVYVDATVRSGSALAPMRSARGLALADADDDGDLDLAIVDLDEPPRLIANRSVRLGRWLSVRTVGRVSNRDGIGARVVVRAGGRTWTREVRTTYGLFSSHDPRLHFGLGAVERVDAVEVLWPSGRRSRVDAPRLDRVLVVEEPSEEVAR